ncbi:DNA-binding response regulator [Vibrio orientalis CIP 102891 = ATCC 33934]|uniref:DNA-binding response regulator n=1 Tax=Vibrio orientalis CIP 102891 = ATCC 33934 TaxID=675816 RepID=C9QHJ7_VIBOR|nr:response regulator transcription factor [Vibrio orientalis]EEX93728.1 two-component system response regulator QseB [Vibrio orientalis CIP 102891 = ATCC 33934]EGU50735.1 DNA-binding response regulator [Vibrio orientalis CIP 102891 = ATCC 33934]
MRILIIEDDLLLGRTLVSSLERCGYTVDWLTEGSGVKQVLSLETFTLIILDLSLPDGDGITLLKSLRQAKYDLPIIILSARDSNKDIILGLDSGADEYIGKPFSFEELLARIRVIVRRQSSSSTHIITKGNFELNLNDYIVKYNDEVLKLTKNEFKILSYLVSNNSLVVSKPQLLQIINGWSETSTENSVEVHIHNLRKKLPNNVIKTIRGIGYTIEK